MTNNIHVDLATLRAQRQEIADQIKALVERENAIRRQVAAEARDAGDNAPDTIRVRLSANADFHRVGREIANLRGELEPIQRNIDRLEANERAEADRVERERQLQASRDEARARAPEAYDEVQRRDAAYQAARRQALADFRAIVQGLRSHRQGICDAVASFERDAGIRYDRVFGDMPAPLQQLPVIGAESPIIDSHTL